MSANAYVCKRACAWRIAPLSRVSKALCPRGRALPPDSMPGRFRVADLSVLELTRSACVWHNLFSTESSTLYFLKANCPHSAMHFESCKVVLRFFTCHELCNTAIRTYALFQPCCLPQTHKTSKHTSLLPTPRSLQHIFLHAVITGSPPHPLR